MIGPDDMSTPVTRGELREEIAQLEIRLDQKLDQKLEQRFTQMTAQMASQMATKRDLELWGGALFERLQIELARHTRAIQETLSRQVSTIDDKYADLPARVSHLETVAFAPKPR
jgi:hypothetical protein